MAIYCRECRFIFQKKYFACPFCGNEVNTSNRSDEDLLRDGYTYSPSSKIKSAASAQTSGNAEDTPDFSIESDDILASLRNGYNNQHREPVGRTSQNSAAGNSGNNRSPVNASSSGNNSADNTSAGRSTSGTASSTGSAAANSGSQGNFFARNTGTSSAVNATPPTIPVVTQDSNTVPVVQSTRDPELEALARQRRRQMRRLRWANFSNSIASWRWDIIFRLLGWIVIACLVVALVSVAIALLPYIIAGAIIIWIFRQFFK